MTTRGRRAGTSGDSRPAILRAARALFAKHGFRGTTLRAIANRAKVDMALVSYFFGSKEELFRAVIDLPVIAGQLEAVLQDGRPGLGERVVRFYLERVFKEQSDTISAMLRTALGDPEDVPTLRTLIRDTLLQGAARALGGNTAKLRAELVGAQMTGLFISRHLVRVEPLASASVDEVAALLGPTLDPLLRGAPAAGDANAPPRHRGLSPRKESDS
jgi:AcrR family transcriptional regulator